MPDRPEIPDRQGGPIHAGPDRAVQLYGWWLIRWRWAAIAASVLLTILAASGARDLWFETDYRVYFSQENPQLRAFDELQATYGKSDNILFVLAPEGGEVFTPEALEAVVALTEAAWQLPFSTRVDSLSNFQHTEVMGDDLYVGDLVEEPAGLDERGLLEVKRAALREPEVAGRLVSRTARVAAVNVTLQLPQESLQEVPRAAAAARELAQRIRAQHPGTQVYLSGLVMLNNAFTEAARADLKTLVPLMYLMIFLVMGLLLRSLAGPLSTLLVVTFSVAAALGAAGWAGTGLTTTSLQAVTMIMTLAVADSVHFLATLLGEMRDGRSKPRAIVESLRVNLQPIFLTSLTTAIGFLSMNFSDSPPFRHLGNMTAAGIGAAFFLTVFLMPALAAVLPLRPKARTTTRPHYAELLAAVVLANRKAFLWGVLPLLLLACACVPMNELNDRFVNYFDRSVPFRGDSDFAMRHLGGLYRMEHSVSAGRAGGISEPGYLGTLDAFAEWYREQPGVVHVSVITDTLKRLNQDLHGGDRDFYRLPESEDLAAQYILLYELSLPYGLDLNNRIDVDKSATRLVATLENVSAKEIRDLGAAAEAWLRANAPEYMFSHAAGGAVMFAHISARNIRSMLKGTVVAVLLISLVLIVSLRSLRIGLVSLFPNALPAAVAFGLWGLFVGEVNLAVSVVAAMTLGIVVDDTVHFLSKYLRARREREMSVQGALHYAFASVGHALVITSLALACGFGVLSLSSFELNATMGIMSAVTALLALGADLLILPGVLMVVDRRVPVKGARRTREEIVLSGPGGALPPATERIGGAPR